MKHIRDKAVKIIQCLVDVDEKQELQFTQVPDDKTITERNIPNVFISRNKPEITISVWCGDSWNTSFEHMYDVPESLFEKSEEEIKQYWTDLDKFETRKHHRHELEKLILNVGENLDLVKEIISEVESSDKSVVYYETRVAMLDRLEKFEENNNVR
ncbi:MAG: hypothetical protein GY861_02455 [bacterium]|nr:hypothetical protein [bacterium]